MSSYTNHIRWVATQSFFIYYSTSSHPQKERRRANTARVPTQGRWKAGKHRRGWHTSCHWCHGSASHCFVRHNLTSLAVSLAFWPWPCWLVEWRTTRRRKTDAQRPIFRMMDLHWMTFSYKLIAKCNYKKKNHSCYSWVWYHKWMSLESQQHSFFFYTFTIWMVFLSAIQVEENIQCRTNRRLCHSLCVNKAGNTAVTQSAWFRDVL